MAEQKNVLVKLSQELHTKLKIAAAQEGVTQKQFVLDAIIDKIEKEKK